MPVKPSADRNERVGTRLTLYMPNEVADLLRDIAYRRKMTRSKTVVALIIEADEADEVDETPAKRQPSRPR
jgi:hypothetical protein